MTVVLPVPSIPRSFAPGTYNGYARAFNFGVTRFTFTPTAASATYTGGNFHILFSGAHGGIWLVDAHLQKFDIAGPDALVYDQTLTWLGNTPITVTDDARAKTVTISGALTGNGTFSYTIAGPYHDVTDTCYLGSYGGGGATFDFVGTVSSVDDLTPDMSWSPRIHEMPVRRAASAALLVAALVAPPVLPSAPVPPLSWAPTIPDYQLRGAPRPLNVGGQSAPEKITLAAAAPAMSWTPQFPDLVSRARSPLNVGGLTGPVAVVLNIPAPQLSWAPVFPDLVPRARAPLNVGGMTGPVAIVLNAPVSPLSWAPTYPDILNRARHPLHAAAGATSPPPMGGRGLTVGAAQMRQNILGGLAFSTPLTTFGTDLTFTAAGNTLTTGTHGMVVTAGPFFLTTTGTLPAGSDSVTPYYAIVPSSTTMQLALTPALAKTGTAVTLSNAGTGTHTLVRAVNTSPLYSTFLAIFARGTQANSPNQATDSLGNTYSYIASAPRPYDNFTTSSFSISISRGKGGPAHTWSASIGNIGGGQDEVMIAGVEIFDATILQSSSVLEVADGSSATITSGAVTTTAKALLVAIIGGNGNVNQGHIFSTPAGYTRVIRACAEGDPDPAGYIQLEVFVRLVDIAGTYKYSTNGTVGAGPEGGMLWHLAFQQVPLDLQPFDWLYRQDEIPRRARRVLEDGETAPAKQPAPAAPLLSWAPTFPDMPARVARRQPAGETAPVLNFAPAPWWPTAPDFIARAPTRIPAGETAPPVVVAPALAWTPTYPDLLPRIAWRAPAGETMALVVASAPVPAISSWAPIFPDAAPHVVVRLQGGEAAPVTTPAPAAVPSITSWSPSFPHALARAIFRQTAGEVAPVAIVPPPVVPPVNSWLPQPVMVPLRARSTAWGGVVGPVLVIPQAPAPPLWAPIYPDIIRRARPRLPGGEVAPFTASIPPTAPALLERPLVTTSSVRLLSSTATATRLLQGGNMKLYLEMFRGESRVITVSVFDPATLLPVNLTSGIWQMATIEWQVKLAINDPDPPLISKSIGAGITVTPGAVARQISVAVTPTDTAGLLAHVYSHDLVGTTTSGQRIWLIDPSGLAMSGVVNQL